MVKNDAGGNKGKGLARKHVNAAKCGSTKQLRVATDAAERYAIVSKMLGNGMCYVRLLDGSTRDRLCIIRNKFKGRGKRDNILDSGSWVLVGMREWSSKQDTCDLLEVYNAAERDRLQKNEPVFKTVEVSSNGNNGSSNTNTNTNTNDGNNTNSNTNSSNSVQFADSTTMKYSSMLNKGASASATSDSDDDVPMQQRVYDMPPSDSDQSDEDDDEDDEEADVNDPSDSDPSDSDPSDSDPSDSDQSDEEEEADQEVQVLQVHKPNAKKAMNKCEINVDDI